MEVLDKIRFVTWVHLPPISVPLPHVPDSKLFPAGGSAFSTHSLMKTTSIFGSSNHALVNVSGIIPTAVERRVKEDIKYSTFQVSMVRFLQCLDWVFEDSYVDKFKFTQIVAYLGDGRCVTAGPAEDGFEQLPYPGDDVPWNEGTLCLIWVDSL